jgi:very-short-patch-repair endonuclease
MQVEMMLRQQHGVISRDQARAAGMSGARIDRQLVSGRWLRVHPRVYLAADRDLTDEARLVAAARWAGEPSSVSGVAAAWWLGLWPAPPTVELTVPLSRCLRPPPGVRVRRRNLSACDRVGVRGLCLTAVPLTVLEAAVNLGERGGELLDRALQRRVRLDALRQAHHRNLSRRGSTAAGRLLAAASDRAASTAERAMITLLRSAGIAGWHLHYRDSGYELDFAFPARRVAIEVDGWAWHSDAGTFRRDRRRQNAVVLAGWTVLRFTWHDLTHSPDQVIAEIIA